MVSPLPTLLMTSKLSQGLSTRIAYGGRDARNRPTDGRSGPLLTPEGPHVTSALGLVGGSLEADIISKGCIDFMAERTG